MTQGAGRRGTQVSAPFWQSVEEGKVKLPFCNNCQSFFFYPRSFCPSCWSDSLDWKEISGYGRVWSFTEVHFPFFRGEWRDRIPYVVALVELEEGVRLLSNIIDCTAKEIQIGMPVQLVCKEQNGRKMPLFRRQRGDEDVGR